LDHRKTVRADFAEIGSKTRDKSFRSPIKHLQLELNTMPETPRYDTKTTDNGDTLFGLGGQDWHTHTTTVRGNQTGKEYSSTNYDAAKSRD